MSDKWISVEDRLPEYDQEILVWYRLKQLPYDINVAAKRYKDVFNSLATHWMPIPEPPSE